MNQGKIPENVLKRSILKYIPNMPREAFSKPGVGVDFCCLDCDDDSEMIFSSYVCSGFPEDIRFSCLKKGANNLYAANSTPVGVMLSILFPIDTEEPDIQNMMKFLSSEAKELGMGILGGHTEISADVSKPVINVTSVGKVKKGQKITSQGAHPEEDVVITKWVGLEGTVILADRYKDKLLSKFPERMIFEARQYDRFLLVDHEAAPAAKSGVTAMHDASFGGIFAGLWELAHASRVGLEIDLRKIPIKQETIEICNFFDLNPYELLSGGSMIMTSPDGNGLVSELSKEGVYACVVGRTTANNDVVVLNGENRRFLEPPKSDEIYKEIK